MQTLYISNKSKEFIPLAEKYWEGLTEDEQEHVITILKDNTSSFFEFSDGCYIEIKEFNDIDMTFIEFLYDNIIDYDHSKHVKFEVLNG